LGLKKVKAMEKITKKDIGLIIIIFIFAFIMSLAVVSIFY